jgi:high-affinity iron transporter
MMKMQRFLISALVGLALLVNLPINLWAQEPASPAAAAETVRSALVQAQLALTTNQAEAETLLAQATAAYEVTIGPAFAAQAATLDQRIRTGLAAATQAIGSSDATAFATARAQVWTAILAGSLTLVEEAVTNGDVATAQQWLPVREFRTATRFDRPNADATVALTRLRTGELTGGDALLTVHADLFDTYQARLSEALRDLADADAHAFAARRAELATLAEGYFAILAPAYGEQRGESALAAAQTAFAGLRQDAAEGVDLGPARQAVEAALHNFRTAPLSPAERARRAGQLLRYLGLVPVEYGRGVSDGRVTKELEIQEALTFNEGAQAAFADLQNLLAQQDAQATGQIAKLLATLDQHLDATSTGAAVADPKTIAATVEQLTTQLTNLMPAEWQKASAAGDFDVINSMLDQVENAVRAGDYVLAESARLEAYAVMETGPEARLMVFAPQLKLRLEELFWNGQGAQKGLAFLINQGAPLAAIKATRAELDAELQTAQSMLAEESAPAAILGNATIIVFREGLEAVLILASLMGSMKLGESRKYRKPLWWGTALAFVATVLTWLLARGVLLALARYGEKLEAVVSLIAIAVLLLITNWFFHKMYWNDWIASFHARKRRLLTGEAGLFVGLLMLGFTSVYREGFETVLFLQALVLEGGTPIVLTGVGLGLAATLLVGFITFRVQARLPYKKMLIVTGIMIGGVLLMMVGTTTHVLQVVGWLPIHVIEQITVPTWMGMWLGLYPTWEGVGLQIAAAAFVIGSYYWAEHLLHAKRPQGTQAQTVEVRNSAQAV